MAIKTNRTVQFGSLIRSYAGLLAETLDAVDSNDYDFSSVGYFDGREPSSRKWLVSTYEWLTVCVTYWEKNEIRCVLSREGNVNLYGRTG